MRIGAGGAGRALAVWGLVAVVVLAVLGLWVITGETGCHPPPASLSSDRLEPEVALPTESEISHHEAETGITLTQ